MTKFEAEDLAARIQSSGEFLKTEVVRILPEHIDPIQPNDNGWDVETTVL